jgi:lipopolysaccharide assembly protein A
MTNLIISTIAAVWIMAIALISVQNASLVSLKFLFWQSIDLPWGLVLAGAVGVGFALGGWISFVVSSNSAPVKRR